MVRQLPIYHLEIERLERSHDGERETPFLTARLTARNLVRLDPDPYLGESVRDHSSLEKAFLPCEFDGDERRPSDAGSRFAEA